MLKMDGGAVRFCSAVGACQAGCPSASIMGECLCIYFILFIFLLLHLCAWPALVHYINKHKQVCCPMCTKSCSGSAVAQRNVALKASRGARHNTPALNGRSDMHCTKVHSKVTNFCASTMCPCSSSLHMLKDVCLHCVLAVHRSHKLPGLHQVHRHSQEHLYDFYTPNAGRGGIQHVSERKHSKHDQASTSL